VDLAAGVAHARGEALLGLGVSLGVDNDDLPVAGRGDAVGQAVERDGLAGPWRADHERCALQSRQRHQDAALAVREDVVVGDVVAEVEGRVDPLARFAHAQRLARLALGLAAGALMNSPVAIARNARYRVRSAS
jgi:hypothetical protein